jgi:hypothetical protein
MTRVIESDGKIYGISYASRHFQNRVSPISKMANESMLFDDFKCFTEEDIDEDFKKKYNYVWKMNGEKQGGGFWIWKPYIIKKMLDSVENGDIIVYFDGGCELNITENSVKRFQEYVDMVNDDFSGCLRFQLEPHLLDIDYTSQKCVDYFKEKFNITNDKMNGHLNSPQIVGGIMIVRKTKFVLDFFNYCLEILDDDPILFTNEYNNGKHHRNDQSVQSLLYKHMKIGILIEDETYFDNGFFNSEKAKNFPIWASRKK